jgi:putative redox protein
MSSNSAAAEIRYAGPDLFIGTSPGGHALVLDTDHERASAPSPVELLMLALGSCTAVDIISILKKKRQVVTEYTNKVTGERRDEFPRSFTKMHVHHIITGFSVDEAAVAKAIELSEEKYCSVAATLRPTVEITSSFEVIEAEPTASGAA